MISCVRCVGSGILNTRLIWSALRISLSNVNVREEERQLLYRRVGLAVAQFPDQTWITRFDHLPRFNFDTGRLEFCDVERMRYHDLSTFDRIVSEKLFGLLLKDSPRISEISSLASIVSTDINSSGRRLESLLNVIQSHTPFYSPTYVSSINSHFNLLVGDHQTFLGFHFSSLKVDFGVHYHNLGSSQCGIISFENLSADSVQIEFDQKNRHLLIGRLSSSVVPESGKIEIIFELESSDQHHPFIA
jgi:hypothetical protein